MKTMVLTSSPLAPLSARMRDLSEQCLQFWAATAFVSRNAVLDALDSAESAGAKVRLLTGTFGNNTRKSTFRAVLRRASKGNGVSAAVWHCGVHGDFHAKLYIWKMRDNKAVAWIGSANLTDGGLQNDGELVLQLEGKTASSHMKKLIASFEREWERSSPLNAEFVRRYIEAKRAAPDHRLAKRKRPVVRGSQRNRVQYFTATMTTHVQEGDALERRVERLLGSGKTWVRQRAKMYRSAKPGDRALLLDQVDGEAALVEIVDVVRDGPFVLLAYDEIRRRNAYVKWNKALRNELSSELGARGRALRSRWLTPEAWRGVAKAFYGPRQRVAE